MSSKRICTICGSSSLFNFLHREQVPVHQNLVMKDQESATQIARGDLSMAVCNECGFVFNQFFDLSKLAYGEDYDNTQACSSYFSSYLEELAHYLIFEKNVRDSCIVEVGCGKGSFLRTLIDIEGTGNIGYGFDPSYIGPASDLQGRLTFERSYYGTECADIAADVVVCRHVIEHVPEPTEFLHTVRQALKKSAHAHVFFETPCVEWILRNKIIWDFFYEHCSLFTAKSLTTAFQAAGFKVDTLRHVFNGQYLWFEGSIPPDQPGITKNPAAIPSLAEEFALSELKLKKEWMDQIQNFSAKGKVALWGAGAKGSTFANLVDPSCTLIDCIVDLNPKKQGHYIPGTGHPIVDYKDLVRRKVKTAILMNPNYREENLDLLREAKIDINLIE